MTFIVKCSWSRRLTVSVISVFMSSCLWAQTGPGSEANRAKPATPLATASPAQSADATAGPHTDSFVIGDDDVLAINVWKEPDISR